MAERNPANNFRLFFFLVVLLLLCGGFQSALACPLPGNQSYSSSIRVNSCHLASSQKEALPCCQIEACHQSTLPQRDLGSPEYHTFHKGSHSLAYESRPLVPQLKVGKPFISHRLVLPHFSSLLRGSQEPLQSLYSLRTVVLLT